MSADHQCLSINGEQLGDLVTVGSRITFFTVRRDLQRLDGRVFRSMDELRMAVKTALRAAGERTRSASPFERASAA